MKKYIFLLTTLLAFLCGCKRQNWIDWKAENEAWMEQNKLNHAGDSLFQVSESGLQYRIIYPGNPDDAMPALYSMVQCTYRGTLINGAQFDGGQLNSLVYQLVPGFSEGLCMLHNKGEIELFIPYQLAYGNESKGTEGTASFIPPYSALIFRVTLDAVY